MSVPRTLVVIGHVDHGKTALVRALTGMETDRLSEEKRRGLSITLGFAHKISDHGCIDLIDAPGHEDFIRAMAAGASGAHGALLVISAADGLEAQTYDHLSIARSLGVDSGVIALTKSDLVGADQREAIAGKLERQVRDVGFEPSATVFCSAHSGEGLDALMTALETFPVKTAPPGQPGTYFLPVDRVFSSPGTGTVVTGTLLGGDLPVDAVPEIGSDGLTAGIRGMQIHGESVALARVGQRVAVNLRGLAADRIRRGDVLRSPGRFPSTNRVHVRLSMHYHRDTFLKHLDKVRVLIGSVAEVASVRLLEDKTLEPGQSGLAELRFAAPVTVFGGQRAAIRRLSPARTLGSATVLDPAPGAIRRRDPGRLKILQAAETGNLAGIAAGLAEQGRGPFLARDLCRLARVSLENLGACQQPAFADLGNGYWALSDTPQTVQRMVLTQIQTFFDVHPVKLAMPQIVLRTRMLPAYDAVLIAHAEQALVRDGTIRVHDGGVILEGRDPWSVLTGAHRAGLDAMETALRDGGVNPPLKAELAALAPDGDDLLALLAEKGRAVLLYNHALRQHVAFHPQTIEQARTCLREAFPPPSPFKTGEARAVLATTRRFIVPLLEHLDALGLTVREGDLRHLAEA